MRKGTASMDLTKRLDYDSKGLVRLWLSAIYVSGALSNAASVETSARQNHTDRIKSVFPSRLLMDVCDLRGEPPAARFRKPLGPGGTRSGFCLLARLPERSGAVFTRDIMYLAPTLPPPPHLRCGKEKGALQLQHTCLQNGLKK